MRHTKVLSSVILLVVGCGGRTLLDDASLDDAGRNLVRQQRWTDAQFGKQRKQQWRVSRRQQWRVLREQQWRLLREQQRWRVRKQQWGGLREQQRPRRQ